MQLLTQEIKTKFEKSGSQEDVEDPKIIAKFINMFHGSARWYAIEYNPQTKIFFGYVTGMGQVDELGTFSLDEMEEFNNQNGTLGFERDSTWNSNNTLSMIKSGEVY